MSFGAGDDSFQPSDDLPGSADVWLYEIPILLRARPTRTGDRLKFLCAGPIWLPRQESRPRGADGLPSTDNQQWKRPHHDLEIVAHEK